MICPHCAQKLLSKERTGQTCSKCKRPFALDPKTNALRVHDVKVRTLVDRLGEKQYYYTSAQLWYAAGLKVVKGKKTDTVPGVAVLGFILGLGLLGFGTSGTPVLVVVGLLVALLTGTLLVLRLSGVWRKRIQMPVALSAFRTQVQSNWQRVYGTALPGMVDESRVRVVEHVPDPVVAILCPDVSVLVCLKANGIPQRLNAALASHPGEVPPHVPVLVLHDASAAGAALPAHARAALPGRRVVDLGLRPKAAMTSKSAPHLREGPPEHVQIGWLRANGLTQEELDWLKQGYWSPIAAMRPRQLIARVESAAAKLRRSADPDERVAAGIGFMTWPSASGAGV